MYKAHSRWEGGGKGPGMGDRALQGLRRGWCRFFCTTLFRNGRQGCVGGMKVREWLDPDHITGKIIVASRRFQRFAQVENSVSQSIYMLRRHFNVQGWQARIRQGNGADGVQGRRNGSCDFIPQIPLYIAAQGFRGQGSPQVVLVLDIHGPVLRIVEKVRQISCQTIALGSLCHIPYDMTDPLPMFVLEIRRRRPSQFPKDLLQ